MLSEYNSIAFILNAFKRHHSKVKKAFIAWAEANGSMTFSYKFSREEGFSTELQIPDEARMMQFVVLMRRFLNSRDGISCQNVWAIIKDNFADILPQENITDVDRTIENLNTGHKELNVNNRELTPYDVYHIIANGEYFDRSDQEAVLFLQEYSNMIGNYLMFKFYDYNMGFLRVSSRMLGLILSIEKSEKYTGLYKIQPLNSNKCIFCMSHYISTCLCCKHTALNYLHSPLYAALHIVLYLRASKAYHMPPMGFKPPLSKCIVLYLFLC